MKRCYGVFIINFEHVLRLFFSVSVAESDKVNVSRVIYLQS